ncbi:ATP-binding protein [Bariatricus sp. SGI.154]|uniref:ATP-binding protein n=1 Tax=Bariatricus sp. SGI.154 TaxID=3420549 RepID=UPI003CFDBC3D
MEFQELILKNFGKFTDRRIQLYDGINILYGENESGKSTIHTFIKGMLFGMERGRGRASVNDTYSIYEPWENPNYYSGALRFRSGGKLFRIDQNFDKYSKKAELICEDDGEQFSIVDGDLDVLLGGLSAGNYENTVSVGQLKVEISQSLETEFKNYATNYYATGNSEINLAKALEDLREKKRVLERDVKNSLIEKQQKREQIEQEASYVWRDVHHLEEERNRIAEELEHRKEREEREEAEKKRMIDELRPAKWRIHPIEIILFVIIVALAFVLITKPWNYLVAIIVFLACGLYVWNRMKVGKKQEKTLPEIMLEEITPEEEKIPLEKLVWERSHLEAELKEKQIQYNNLQEQLAELDEVSDDYREYDKRRLALQMAIDQLNELSGNLQKDLEKRLNGNASEILRQITNGKYSRLIVDEGLHMSVFGHERRIPMEQLSRGTVEQIYFALRMAAGGLLHEEEYPVVLDDTFAYYDDVRLGNTLKWLSENKRQVVILTCQKREKQMLDELGIAYHEFLF